MSALTALLARDRIVSPQRIDEAIQRQVINGGDLETNLLEIGVVHEDTLAAYCAAVYRAEAALCDEVVSASPDAVARVSREIAETHRLVPLRIENNTLVIAVTVPLPDATKRTLEQLVGLGIEARVVTPFRLQWALGRFYGSEISVRLQRLAQRLDGQSRRAAGGVSNPPAPALSKPAPIAPQTATNPRGVASALAALSAALKEERDSEVPLAPVITGQGSIPSTAGQRVPFETARERIGAAQNRDQIVEALLEHTSACVAYVALFTIRGDVAEGLDARGRGLSTEAVRRLSVPLNKPGAFHRVHEKGEGLVSLVTETPADQAVKDNLRRPKEATVALLPIQIGGRVVLIAWADHGTEPMRPSDLREITAASAEASRAFERLIVERKRKKAGAGAEAGANGTGSTVGQGMHPSGRPSQRSAFVPTSTGITDEEIARLVAEAARTGYMNDAAATRLLNGGERTLTVVFQYFPGPTAVDRTHPQSRIPPPAEAGPLLRLVVMFRQTAAPYLVECLESQSPEQRYFAVLCLTEVVHPPALLRLAARLFDTDYPVRSLAVEALRAYQNVEGFDQVYRTLRSTVADPAASSEYRRIAANALGELRDAAAVPALLFALGEPDAALAGLARRALVVLTRQDLGEEPASWQNWWQQCAKRHRIEWLIEALLHSDPTIRNEASEELKKLTGQFFGYYFNLPRRERESAYQQYREWWEQQGRAQFVTR